MATPTSSRSEMISGKRKKTKPKRTMIDCVPNIPLHEPEDYFVPYAVSPTETKDGAVAVGVDGSSICPIYVSDYEDSSERAIRGDRKIDREILKAEHLAMRSKNNNDNSNRKTKKKKDRDVLPLPPRTAADKNDREDHQKVVDDDGDNDDTEKSSLTTLSKKKRDLKKSITKLSNQKMENNNIQQILSKENLDRREKEPLCIDVTALKDEFDDENDPILERELEEIALNGHRSGLISGTPKKSAYDVENGKAKGWRRLSQNSSSKKNKNHHNNNKNFSDKNSSNNNKNINVHKNKDDDDSEKSWHIGTLTKDKDEDTKKQKHMTRNRKIYCNAILFVVTVAVILLFYGVVRRLSPNRAEPLTVEQQKIHDILVRVTGPKKTAPARNSPTQRPKMVAIRR
mmetsp:Transcript_25818/g.56618  ORF Transcript_25818/g.56618 Transcript_25818/m.56618 type:complete len:399 (+) Transcript_25818:283-1479(+)